MAVPPCLCGCGRRVEPEDGILRDGRVQTVLRELPVVWRATLVLDARRDVTAGMSFFLLYEGLLLADREFAWAHADHDGEADRAGALEGRRPTAEEADAWSERAAALGAALAAVDPGWLAWWHGRRGEGDPTSPPGTGAALAELHGRPGLTREAAWLIDVDWSHIAWDGAIRGIEGAPPRLPPPSAH